MAEQNKGSRELFSEVIEAGLCTLCGACAGACPYLVSHKGKIVLMDNCTLATGQCYKYCPRTSTDLDAVSQHLFKSPYSAEGLGTVKEVLIARSTDPAVREKAQYGGTVSTLLILALAEGLVEGAITSKMAADGTASAVWSQTKEEVLATAGSNYAACSTLEMMNKTLKGKKASAAVVAMPCQALVLAKMKKDPPQNRADINNVKLVIGLFCTWALSPRDLANFLKSNVDLPKVRKFDIPPPPAKQFEVYYASGKKSFPLDAIRKLVMPTCSYCLDMTSEFADISVGLVEGMEGWNTVIVRTQAGAELLEKAKKQKKLEVGKLPPENLAHLKEAALLKRKRALNAIVGKTGDRKNLLYLSLSTAVVEKLLDKAGG